MIFILTIAIWPVVGNNVQARVSLTGTYVFYERQMKPQSKIMLINLR